MDPAEHEPADPEDPDADDCLRPIADEETDQPLMRRRGGISRRHRLASSNHHHRQRATPQRKSRDAEYRDQVERPCRAHALRGPEGADAGRMMPTAYFKVFSGTWARGLRTNDAEDGDGDHRQQSSGDGDMQAAARPADGHDDEDDPPCLRGRRLSMRW